MPPLGSSAPPVDFRPRRPAGLAPTPDSATPRSTALSVRVSKEEPPSARAGLQASPARPLRCPSDAQVRAGPRPLHSERRVPSDLPGRAREVFGRLPALPARRSPDPLRPGSATLRNDASRSRLLAVREPFLRARGTTVREKVARVLEPALRPPPRVVSGSHRRRPLRRGAISRRPSVAVPVPAPAFGRAPSTSRALG